MGWDLLRNARAADSVVNTGIKLGGTIMAGVAISKWAKKKGKETDALSGDQLELKKMELELQKAKIQAETDKITQPVKSVPEHQPIPQPMLAPQSSVNSQEKLLQSYELFKAGAISQEDYDAVKRQVLGI